MIAAINPAAHKIHFRGLPADCRVVVSDGRDFCVEEEEDDSITLHHCSG